MIGKDFAEGLLVVHLSSSHHSAVQQPETTSKQPQFIKPRNIQDVNNATSPCLMGS